MSALDPDLHVLDVYARLAANRAVDARVALRHSQTADELLAQSAQALEDAAGTLTLAHSRQRIVDLSPCRSTADTSFTEVSDFGAGGQSA